MEISLVLCTSNRDAFRRFCRACGIERRRLILVPLLLMLGGCKAGNVAGVSLTLGSYERGLWFDHDQRQHQPAGFGMKLDLVAGYMILPIPKYWQASNNPWKGDEPWFVIRSPMAGPYLSLAVGDFGAYFGCKSYKVEDKHRSLDRLGTWMREDEFPDPNGVRVYLQPSVSLRRTRWK